MVMSKVYRPSRNTGRMPCLRSLHLTDTSSRLASYVRTKVERSNKPNRTTGFIFFAQYGYRKRRLSTLRSWSPSLEWKPSATETGVVSRYNSLQSLRSPLWKRPRFSSRTTRTVIFLLEEIRCEEPAVPEKVSGVYMYGYPLGLSERCSRGWKTARIRWIYSVL